MICRLVPSSQGAFVYPVPVSELFKRLLISAWRAKMDAMKPNKQRANSKKLYLNSPADTSKQCWTLELQLSRRCRRSLTNVVERHMRLCPVYICVAWKVESGGTLNNPSNLFFLLPETRLVGVKKNNNTWAVAETLPAQFNWAHRSSPIARSLSLFMSHHTFDCLSVRRNFIAGIDHSTGWLSGFAPIFKTF